MIRGVVMESRTEKYLEEQTFNSNNSTRSSRNARLYREVYGKYNDLDNLPLEDNTNEIDMESLRELVLNSTTKKETREIKENLNILEQRKRNIDEQKIYDINKILEKAKYENKKLKGDTATLPRIDKKILQTLQSTEISLTKIQEAKARQEKAELAEQLTLSPAYQAELTNASTNCDQANSEEKLSMTRELKYHNLAAAETDTPNLVKETTSDFSLDLFSDLKPTENTITTKPITETTEQHFSEQINPLSTDTSDIDIIKPAIPSKENDFFTSSYEFSKKDFSTEDDDDFFDEPKKSGIFKIILLFLAITIFAGVIVYFILNYGLGV